MATFNAVSPRVVFSLHCDFALETFARGLASEDADQHAQRFVAVIAQRSLPCYASKLPIFASLKTES